MRHPIIPLTVDSICNIRDGGRCSTHNVQTKIVDYLNKFSIVHIMMFKLVNARSAYIRQ